MLFPSLSQINKFGYVWADYYFRGYLDDFRIYNRALSADEISEIYNKTKNKY